MEEKQQLQLHYNYPYSPDYYYESRLKKINLDKKREQLLAKGKSFVVGKPQSTLKKEFKNDDGIYSSKFGRTMQDKNPFSDRYKCKCGFLSSRLYNGITCPFCKEKVKFVDDDFGYFAWITLKDPYRIIHPNIYKQIQALCTCSKVNHLENMLKPIDNKDINGHHVNVEKSKDEPYKGIGMLDFIDRFDEIMQFYLKKNPNKKKYYDDIMLNRDKVFTQSIPVYTIHLRPFHLEGIKLAYEETNAMYIMMTKLAFEINNDELKILRKRKTKNQLLYDLNNKLLKLYNEIIKIFSSKKGKLRSVFGGRYTFASRSVIVPNPSLRIDEVIMPYKAMVELLQQTIINILQKSYNISYADAYNIWFYAKLKKDQRVWNIIKYIIKDKPRGIPILINRNPTIAYGGILQMFVVDICESYTMSLPLQVLVLLGADFDGDVLNILYIINKEFFKFAFNIFNPRNAFYISRNDAKLNTAVLFNRDTMININSFLQLSRKYYSKNQLEKIRLCQTAE